MEEERRLGDIIAGQLLASEIDAISAARAIAEAEDVRANPAPRPCSMPGLRSCCPCAGDPHWPAVPLIVTRLESRK